MSLKKKIAANVVLRLLGKFGSLAISLFVIGILTRHLGPSNFGYYTVAMTFIQIFSTLTNLRLPQILTRRISQADADQEVEVSNIVTLQAVAGAIFTLAPLVALFFPYDRVIPIAIAIAAISGWTGLLRGVLNGIFERNVATWKVGVVELVGRVLTLIGTLIVAVIGGGLLAFIMVLSISSIGQFMLTLFMAKKYVTIRPRINYQLWLSTLRESWPLAVMAIIGLAASRSDILLLSIMRSPAEVGLYSAAQKILNVIGLLPPIFLGLVFPLLALEWSRHNLSGLRHKMSLSFDLLAIIILPIVFGTLATASDIMAFVGGIKFIAAGPILTLFMISASTTYWRSLCFCVILAAGQQQQLIKYHVINAVFSFFLFFKFIPPYGIYAAAMVVVLSQLFMTVVVTIIMNSLAHFRPNFQRLSKIFIASGLMCALLISLKGMPFFPRFGIGVATYFILSVLSRSFSLTEIRAILK